MMTCKIVSRLAWRRAGAMALLLTLTAGATAVAAVRVDGDVTPADNAATFGFEGIVDYRFVINFDDEVLVDQPLYANPFDIVVGDTSYGLLVVDQASALRYENLVIGGSAEDIGEEGEFEGSTTGAGIVRIDGFGSLINNDPDIISPSLLATGVTSELEIDSSPRTGTGMDVYVGLTGSGQLEVLDGGRMEIQDSLIVGAAEGSLGIVQVSGFGSYIDQRGQTGSTSGTDPETTAMVIGAEGEGSLIVSAGGLVDAREGLGIASLGIGSTGTGTPGPGIPIDGSSAATGIGTVEVEGLGSRLRAAAGVAVGVYSDDRFDYEPTDGNGTLYVRDNALVSIFRLEDDSALADDANLLVGLYGRVELANSGRISVSDGLYNDGQIHGDGRIDLGTFSNRRDGLINISQGERLRISSSAVDAITDDTSDYFMANNGLIDVIGGELVFQRVFTEELDMFQNRIDPANDDQAAQNGRIHGQDAVLRFGSGLRNEAIVAFTAGDNVLSGDVLNDVTGAILISGNSNVVFEDDLTNLGDIELAPDGTTVSFTVLGDFNGLPASSLSLALGGGPTGSQLSSMAIGGDISLGGLLNVDLSASGISPLDPQPGDEFEIISGTGLLDGAFNALALPMLSDPTWSWFIDTSNSDVTLVVLDVIPIGADFNGDGIVDEADLAVWRANFGIEMGASGVLGDADGDGDVDGRDYLIWISQVGGAGMPVPGALVGPASFVTNVPEPSSVALLFGGVVGAWYLRRRQAA